MNLKAETRDRLGVTWYSMAREFSLPPGAYQARVVIRDRTSGRVGSVTHGFEVPPLTGFRVSSPILTDVLQNDPTGQTTPKPVLLARRTFLGGSTLYCQFTAYGASLDPSTGKAEGERELGAEAGRRDAGARVADHDADARARRDASRASTGFPSPACRQATTSWVSPYETKSGSSSRPFGSRSLSTARWG